MRRHVRRYRLQRGDLRANRLIFLLQIRHHPLCTIGLDKAFEIEQGKSLAELQELRMSNVLCATHQGARDFLLCNGFAKLVAEQRAECGRPAAQIPILRSEEHTSELQ